MGVMRRLGILASVLFMLIGAAWAVSSPVGSSPDDDFHLTSIWCAWGDRADACTIEVAEPVTVSVPARVVHSSDCLWSKPTVNGPCPEALLDATTHGETSLNHNLYPALYYKVAGLMVGPDVAKSVVLIRLFNVLLAGLLLLGVFLLSPTIQRRSYLLAFSVVSIPLGVFVVASTNPSSWTFVGAAAYWLYLLLWMDGLGVWSPNRLVPIALGLLLSAAMLTGSRADGAVLAIIETAAIAIVYGRRDSLGRGSRVARFLPGILVVLASIAVVLTTSQLRVGGHAVDGMAPSVGLSGAELMVRNLLAFPTLIIGVVGGGDLGWLNTEMPEVTRFVGSVLLGSLAFIGLGEMWTRKAMALLLLCVPLVALPLAFLQVGGNVIGEEVQPRYVMPALVAFVGILLLTRTECLPWMPSRAQGVAFVAALTCSGSFAFLANEESYPLGEIFPAQVWPMESVAGRAWLFVLVLLSSIGYNWIVVRTVIDTTPEGIAVRATESRLA